MPVAAQSKAGVKAAPAVASKPATKTPVKPATVVPAKKSPVSPAAATPVRSESQVVSAILAQAKLPARAYLLSSKLERSYSGTDGGQNGSDSSSKNLDQYTFKYSLDAQGRPLLVQRDQFSQNSYTSNGTPATSSRSDTSYFRYFYSANAIGVASFRLDQQDGSTKPILDRISGYKISASPDQLVGENVYFEPYGDRLGKVFSANIFKSAIDGGDVRLLSLRTPDDYNSNSSASIATVADNFAIKLDRTESKIGIQSTSSDGEAIKGTGSFKFKDAGFQFSTVIKGDPAKPSRANGSYLIGSSNEISFTPFSGGGQALLQWLINDVMAVDPMSSGTPSVYGSFIVGAALGQKPFAVRYADSSNSSNRSDGKSFASQYSSKIDPLTGLYTSGVGSSKGTYRLSQEQSLSSYEDKNSFENRYAQTLSAGNLIEASAAQVLDVQLTGLVNQAKAAASTYSLSDWLGSSSFLFPSLV